MKIVNKTHKFTNNLSTRTATNKIVVHHAAAKSASSEDIHKWHLNNGWAGIGYQFVVRKTGVIETGRPIDKVGAHCTGHNNDSIGICFEGNFDEEKIGDAQLTAGKELIVYLRSLYGDNIKIVRHKDLASTACPGKNFPFDDLIKKSSSAQTSGSGSTSKQSTIIHTIKEGETLYSLGLKYKMDWLNIATYNNIKSPWTIYPGDKIKIPGADDVAVVKDTVETYTVKEGDTLSGIGLKYKIDWNIIAEYNGIKDPDKIYPGDKIKIPTSSTIVHTVKEKDTLYSLGIRYGVDWLKIASDNGINSPYRILPGQKLKIKL